MKELLKDNYKEILNNDNLSLVLFKIEGCSPCTAIERKIKTKENDYKNWRFYQINLTRFREISGVFEVFTSPTIILFNKGKELTRFSRNFSLNSITEYIKRVEENLF